jgi:hypothetical protein
MRRRLALHASLLLVAAAVTLAVACDQGDSCPSHPCDPLSDGTPLDLIGWCETSGQCVKDGVSVPVCPHPDAATPPACALDPVDTGETLTLPIGRLVDTLGGRRDLVITYADCEDVDGSPPDFGDLQVLYDGVPAPRCASGNPCDPGGGPTVMTCAAVPKTVDLLTISFSYNGAKGKTTLLVEMQDSACSYYCG